MWVPARLPAATDGFVELADFGYGLVPNVTLRLTATLQTDATPEGSDLTLRDDFDVLLGECTLGQTTIEDDSGRFLCEDCDNEGLLYSQDPTAQADCQACPLSDKGVLAAKCTGAKIELLNAPNNPKQVYEVFTNNGDLNRLVVCFDVPDAGNTLRVVNLATVEFPCYANINQVEV